MSKRNSITVQGAVINMTSVNSADYISLTDMAKEKDGDTRAADVIKNWLRNRSTLEFLGAWETLYNSDFKVVKFDHFKKEAGLPTFTMSVSDWVESTNAKGIFSVKGKYGGTYAHRDIAFEFGAAISPVFKLYIIKEYQRLKEIETNKYNLEWDVRRILSKTNYKIHTEAIKEHIIPKAGYFQAKQWLLYAKEADILNIALFGCTAKQWRDVNPQRVLNGENIRDMASINELTILSNIESLNSILIKKKDSSKDRLKVLMATVQDQRKAFEGIDIFKSIKNGNETTYIDTNYKTKDKLSDFNEKIKKGIEYNPKKKNANNLYSF